MAAPRAARNNNILEYSTDSEMEGAAGAVGGTGVTPTSGRANEGSAKRSGRKRVRNPKLWRSTIAKRLRTAGEGYTSRSQNNRVVIVPPVRKTAIDCHCKRLCFNSVTTTMRESVVKAFYELETKELQDSYLYGLITLHSVKQRRKRLPDSTKQRGGSFLYKVGYNIIWH
jgi:hypothetical protein